MRLVKKIFGKVLESHVIVVKVVRHGQVDIGGLELQVDVAGDGSLGFWKWFGCTCKGDSVINHSRWLRRGDSHGGFGVVQERCEEVA